MIRKSLSLVATLFVTLLLLGTQRSSQAQTVGANCIAGSGSSAVQVRANGYLNNGLPTGLIYYRLPNGQNFTGSFRSLSFVVNPDGSLEAQGTAWGYLFGPTGVIAKVQVNATFDYDLFTGERTAEITANGIFGSVFSYDSGEQPVRAGNLLISG